MNIAKFESNLIKQDESKYIEVNVNAKTTMSRIDSMFGPFDQADIDYYLNYLLLVMMSIVISSKSS